MATLSAAGKPLGRPPKAAATASETQLKSILKAAKVLARYDAAGRGRRMAGWTPPATGPNSAMNGSQLLRDRAEDSVRNDWAAESTIQKWGTALIGIGITPRFKRIADTARRKAVTDLFSQFAQQIDADGVANYYAQQTLVVRTWLASGECFVRERSRFASEGLAVPMQVQVLDPAMVPLLDADTWQNLPAGNYIRSGVEFNNRGKRVAYWVYKQHPHDMLTVSTQYNDYVRVAASEMAHIFEQKRPGQIRGISSLATVLVKLREIGDYEDAVLVRQKLANLFVAFIKRSLPSLDPTDPMYGALTGMAVEQGGAQVGDLSDVQSPPLMPMAPGLMQELEDGQDITFANPPEAGTNYSDYMRTSHLGSAAGAGLPYELYSGDIINVSDRTLRVIINEFRRFAEQRQWQIVIPMYCQRVIEWFTDAAVLSGQISLAESADVRRVEHAPHGWTYIHPVQDPQGKALEVTNGFRSRSSVITEKGDDPIEVDEERLADQQREDAMGIRPPPSANTPAAEPVKPQKPVPNARLDDALLERTLAEREVLRQQLLNLQRDPQDRHSAEELQLMSKMLTSLEPAGEHE